MDQLSPSTFALPAAVRLLSRHWLTLALVSAGICAGANLQAAAPEVSVFPTRPVARPNAYEPVPKEELPAKEVTALRKAVIANPADVNQIITAYMRRHPAAVASTLRTAALALPLKQGKPDVAALSALLNFAVAHIYKDLPAARDEVKTCIFVVVDALRGNGGDADVRDVLFLAQSVVPILLENEPSLASMMMDYITKMFPHSTVLFAQMRALFTFASFNSGGSDSVVSNPGIPSQVEAPEIPPATQIIPPPEDFPPTEFAAGAASLSGSSLGVTMSSSLGPLSTLKLENSTLKLADNPLFIEVSGKMLELKSDDDKWTIYTNQPQGFFSFK